MKDLEIAFRLLRRHLSLRLVNLAGLSVVLATLLISVNYVRRELSWDRYNREADRTVRLTVRQYDRRPDTADAWSRGHCQAA